MLYWRVLIILTSALPNDPIRSRRAVFNIFRVIKGGPTDYGLPFPPRTLSSTMRGPRRWSVDSTTHIWPPLLPQTSALQPPLGSRGIHTVLGKTGLGKGCELFLQAGACSMIREFWGLENPQHGLEKRYCGCKWVAMFPGPHIFLILYKGTQKHEDQGRHGMSPQRAAQDHSDHQDFHTQSTRSFLKVLPISLSVRNTSAISPLIFCNNR